jgi:DNA-binding response OmpR family regulator
MVSGIRVLIIDDNEDAAQLLAMFVSALGHVSQVANSGATGLQLAESFHPDIVFLDLGMPGMSGFDVAPRLRLIAGLERTYIAALTGWNDLKTRSRVAECGFDQHLTKPASIEHIQDILAAHAH